MSVTFRQVERDEEVEALAHMAYHIWNEYWPAIIGQAQTDYMVEKFQSLNAFRTDIADNGYEYFFIMQHEDETPHELGAATHGADIHDQGDTTVTKLTVTSIDRDADNGYVTINGGIEAGGVELTLDHDVYRTVTFDDYPVYYEMGEVTLPLAGGVTLSNSSADPQASAVETDGADAVAEAVNAEPDGWMPNNTLVFTEDGTISSIVRIWVP